MMASRHTLAESLSAGGETTNRIREALQITNDNTDSANEAAYYISDLLSALEQLAASANLGVLREALIVAQHVATEKVVQIDSSVTVSDDYLGGIPVFTGTRVPIQNLFDVLEGDENIESFLSQFPDVDRSQAIDVLRRAALNIGLELLQKRVSDADA